MKYIRFAIKNSSSEGNANKFVIGRLESNLSGVNRNELPVVLNALAKSVNLVKENTGFPYIFPFQIN